MAAHIVCPRCGMTFHLPEALLGRTGRCSRCRHEFHLQASALPPPEPVAAPPPRPRERERRPARAPARKAPVGLIVGLVLGVLLLVGGLGITGLLIVSFRDSDMDSDIDLSSKDPGPRTTIVQTAVQTKVKKDTAPPPPPDTRPSDTPKPPVNPPPPAAPATGFKPPTPMEIKPPALAADKVVKALPGRVESAVLGGGGRFLFLKLAVPPKLLVFDVSTAEIVKELPLDDASTLFAAGMEKLFLLNPTKRVIQRWSLRSFEKEMEATLSIPPAVNGLRAGHASSGPVLMTVQQGPNGGPGWFLDPETLSILKTSDTKTLAVRAHPALTHASADGRVWVLVERTLPVQIWTFDGRTARRTHQGSASGSLAIPGPDGKVMYGYTLLSDTLGSLSPHGYWSRRVYLPAAHGPWYLEVVAPDISKSDRRSNVLAVYLPREEKPLVEIDKPEGLFGAEGTRFTWEQSKPPIHERVHLIPEAGLIVTLPLSADQVVLYKMDFDAALARAFFDHLFVTSRPPPTFRKGGTYSYEVVVKSKKGGVQYEVEAGPAGLSVDAGGKVVWKVPADFAENEAAVTLAVRDASGQRAVQRFTITAE